MLTRGFDAEDNLFLLPGPVKIHPRILRAMQRPAIGHRSPEFKRLVEDVGVGLKGLFLTNAGTCVLTASATAGMEAAVSNLLRPDDAIVVATNGRFGERFVDIARRYAPKGTHVVESKVGQAIDLDRLEATVAKVRPKAVAVVLNESSTGVRNDGERVGAICRKHNAYYIADGVTAVGGMTVPVDAWGIDVCIVGSQKCLGAPPGLAYVSCSTDALAELKSPSLYLDLKSYLEKAASGETPFTPATHLFFATAEALEMLEEETLPARLERTRRVARAFRAGLGELGLDLLPAADVASDTVTAIRLPDGTKGAKLKDRLKADYGVVVAGGQGDLQGKILRAGHMGLVEARELATLLTCLEHALDPKARTGAASAFLEASR